MRDHFHDGFPSERSAADAAFNASYNASWILLKQSTAFLYESLYSPCHRRRCHARVSTPVESVATLVKEKCVVGKLVGQVDMKLEQRNDNIPVASLSPVEETPAASFGRC